MAGPALPRKLRHDQTDAERKLWGYLRNRRMLDVKFRRQVQIDRYVVDFLCWDARLIIELDGSQHGDRETYDAERTHVLEAAGFNVLRFWNNDVSNNIEGVLTTIRETLVLSGERDR